MDHGATEVAAPMLRGDTTADVCIVGAGLAGLTTAYLLSRENIRVVVLEAGPIASGETCRTTAHLANAIDDRYTEIERLHGLERSRAAAASHSAAIDLIESIAETEGIACDFKRLDGYLFPHDNEALQLLRAEKAAARRAGLKGVELVENTTGFLPRGGTCLRFPRQAQFNPLKYLGGLIDAIERQGGRLYADTRVREVEEKPDALVHTENGATVSARSVVIATNSPINNRVTLHAKQAPYRTYVVAFDLPAGTVAPALYWDTADPYHYVRLAVGDGDRDVLIVGGEDHKTGQEAHTDGIFTKLEYWARKHFPQVGSVTHRWSGQVMETTDGLAFLGRNPGSPPNIYVATGDSGMGMTHGTLAGVIISDLIQGRKNRFAELYDPARITINSTPELVKENVNMAAQYLDWVIPTKTDAADLPPQAGCVIQRGPEKIAVYRAPDGTQREMSAVCPHLGGIVRWNETENTWDCPCHGSRFAADGTVINGPAYSALAPVGQLSAVKRG